MTLPFHSDFTCQYYSKNDFLRLIEQRVKKELRLTGELDLDRTFFIPRDGKITSEVLVVLLQHIFGDRISVTREESENTELLGTQCLEEFLKDHLHVFFNKDDVAKLGRGTRQPLRVVSIEEIKQLAECFKVEGNIPETDEVFIDKLQEKYKQTKPSLLKSFMALEEKLSHLN